ncbi:MAG: chemotaxis protein CheC [Halanaeroarchaeum sp.]
MMHTPSADLETVVAPAQTTVAIEFTGALDGRALLVFDAETASHIADRMGGGALETDALRELTNIMTSSFVDGWAAHLEEPIDISTPRALEGDAPLIPPGDDIDGHSFVFHSTIQLVADGSTCEYFLVPEPEGFLSSIRKATAKSMRADVEIEELTAFLKLTAAGGETVANQLETMTGIDADVAVSQLNFVPVEDVPTVIDETQYLGTVFQFEGPLSGLLAIMFEADSADLVADAMMPGGGDSAELRRSAIKELGNITASGFIDGWANAMGGTIDHSVPDFVDDMGRAILDAIAVRLGQTETFAAVFDVTVTADDPIECRVFAFPEPSGLRDVITSLDADRDVETVERL